MAPLLFGEREVHELDSGGTGPRTPAGSRLWPLSFWPLMTNNNKVVCQTKKLRNLYIYTPTHVLYWNKNLWEYQFKNNNKKNDLRESSVWETPVGKLVALGKKRWCFRKGNFQEQHEMLKWFGMRSGAWGKTDWHWTCRNGISWFLLPIGILQKVTWRGTEAAPRQEQRCDRPSDH